MAYGKGMVSCDDMNAHKAMAGADSKGNFGVQNFSSAAVRKGGAAARDGGARGDGSRREPKA